MEINGKTKVANEESEKDVLFHNGEHEEALDLTLALHSHRKRMTPSLQSPPASKTRRHRVPCKATPDTIEPPFPWATDRRAAVHSLHYLLSKNILSVYGDMHCKQCNAVERVTYDVQSKFSDLSAFIVERKEMLHNRAPAEWSKPALPCCRQCGKTPGFMSPLAEKKRAINWLFLFLGQMLGCLSLSQLKYFCKHNQIHRTGAKDRLLFSAYICLCKQLDPSGPFK